MKHTILYILLLTIASCTRQAPQLPANKQLQVDSLAISVQKANELLIAGEDSIIAAYIRTKGLKMTQSTSGLWYEIKSKNTGKKPRELENCKLWYSVSLLTDSIVMERTETIVIGKKQIINGIEEALMLMSPGDEAHLLIPWHLAYGMKGSGDEVPAYTSIKVHLKRL